MKILLIGGTWDLKEGKTSGIINKFDVFIKKELEKTDILDVFNGGNYENLNNLLLTSVKYDAVFWMANVSNDLPKIRNIKDINPHALVIGSKRNDDNKYSFVEVLNKSLEQKHNLTLQFSKEGDNFKFLLFDPLGTSWYEGFDLEVLVKSLINRLRFLLTTRRAHTYKAEGAIKVPDNELFFEYVRQCSEIFHKTIEHADGVTRFLGNASFRGNDDIIFVSQRDVDKRFIGKETFVPVYLKDDKVFYIGENKPSKDTVVQTRLYKKFKNINFIIHTHCYVENGTWTENSVPCGSLNEIDELYDVLNNKYNNNFDLDYYIFNLKGHGSLIMGSSIEKMKQTNFITRHLPEDIGELNL